MSDVIQHFNKKNRGPSVADSPQSLPKTSNMKKNNAVSLLFGLYIQPRAMAALAAWAPPKAARSAVNGLTPILPTVASGDSLPFVGP